MKNKIKKILKAMIPSRLRPRIRLAYKKIRFFGLRHLCPFCKSRLGRFLPYGLTFPVLTEKKVVGGGYRLNTLCPVCDSFDRERLLYLHLVHKTEIFSKPQKVLHIAPEVRVRNVLTGKANIDYLTADLMADNVMAKVDITDIRYPDNSFDSIICNHVLEHVIDDRKAMSELYRVLKPGGWAILQVPMSLALESTYEDFTINTPEGREIAFGQNDHVRIYAKDYVDRLSQAGFKVELHNWYAENDNFGGRANRFGLNEEECVYRVSKPAA